MALPREPRQKMINIMYLVLTAILALNVSAEILTAFKTVDKSLMNSTRNIGTANEAIYSSLNEKLSDPKTAEKAAIWAPKAEMARKYSAELDTYINTLKQDLKKEAGLRMKEKDGVQVEDFKEDNLDASTRLFETNGRGEELQKRLDDYKTKMLNIDPEIKAKFDKTFPVETVPPVGIEGKQKGFTATYFHMTPTVAALTMLSKFQNSVKNGENQVVSFIHDQIGAVKVKFDKTGVLVGQSSNYVMPGQEITITAGIGAYSSAAQPRISIGGAGVQAIDGKGTYKVIASGAGKRTVPVTITYLDQDGKEQSKTETVEYTVGTPSGAAVMLDKMNVFYIGVDNPVTIGSSTGWDKTTVSMSGGSISGSGSSRTVRVSNLGKASITVSSDGKSSTFDFRVKRIPDPVFKVGSGKPRVATVEFKSQQFCRAELENFDFDLKYNVVSAVVYFSGANFPNVAQGSISSNSLGAVSSLVQRCGPGSVVTFDQIKVSGPDGTRSIEGRSFALY